MKTIKDYNYRKLALILSYAVIMVAMLMSFARLANAMDVTLEWDVNTETCVIGYSVYARNYDEEEFRPLEDVVGRTTNMITFYGLSDDMNWCFVVTAFSVDQESGNSNIACTDEIDDSDDSGSGGGKGCFVSTAFADENETEKCHGIDCLWEALAGLIKVITFVVVLISILIIISIIF